MEAKTYYDMEPSEFFVDDTIKADDNIQYELSDAVEQTECPYCHKRDIWKFGGRDLYIRDLPSFGRNVGLHIASHRFRCKVCGGTWSPVYESIDVSHKMTVRLRKYIENESLKKPFTTIEKELSISDTTIRRVFDDYIRNLDKSNDIHAPRVLGIDENHVCNRYRAVFTDIENRFVIDMLPKRTKGAVMAWINALPDKERIECVTCDMWEPYKDAAYACLGDGIFVVVDKFHVIKMVNDALEKIRRRLNKEIDWGERRYLRNSKWLMLHNSEDLDEKQGKALYELFDNYPEFETPYRLKESFRDIYDCKERTDAETAFDEWKAKLNTCPEFEPIAETVDNWHKEIFNYFEHRFTNAVTENLNKMINDVARSGKGYSFDVLRAKVLYRNKAMTSAKYEFKKPDKPSSEKVLVCGSGINIDEAEKLLKRDEFWIN